MESKRDIFQAIADSARRATIVILTMDSIMTNTLQEHFDSSRQNLVLSECNYIKPHQQKKSIFP